MYICAYITNTNKHFSCFQAAQYYLARNGVSFYEVDIREHEKSTSKFHLMFENIYVSVATKWIKPYANFQKRKCSTKAFE